jgi:hypothetical protein
VIHRTVLILAAFGTLSAACVSIGAPTPSAGPTATAPATPSSAPTLVPTTAPSPTIAPTPSSAPTATPGPNLGIAGRIVNADQGYAITLPAGWLRLDLESGLSEFIHAAALADPTISERCQSTTAEELEACLKEDAGDVVESFGALTDSGAQIAMDLASVDNGFPTLVLILVQPKSIGTTPELLLAVGPKSLRAVGVTGRIEKGLVDVPAGTAVYFDYALPVSEGIKSRARDFYVIGDAIFEVLVVAHKSNDGLENDADALIESLELLP